VRQEVSRSKNVNDYISWHVSI